MLDTARLAAMADPNHSPLFGRRWTGPPPRTRKTLGVAAQGSSKSDINSKSEDRRADAAAQAAVRHAVRRLREIERRAELFAAVGLADAALRLEVLAERIKAEVLL
jgi:hypothetical protein